VLKAILQLRQQIKVLAKLDIFAALFRLALIAAFATFFHLSALLAMVAGTCAIIAETYFFVRVVKPQVDWEAPTEPEYRATLFGLVKKTAPFTIYFCISGQLSIWLISFFGSVHQVADVGAAQRLGIIFAVLSSVYSAMMIPRFGRSNGRRLLYLRLLQIVTSFTILMLAIIALTKLWPDPFILLLGAKYTNMAGLLWLVMLGAGIYSLAGIVFNLNMVKGWVPPAIVTIPVEIVTQIVLILSMDLSKTENVLIFGCLAQIPPAIVNTVMLLRRIRLEPEEPVAQII